MKKYDVAIVGGGPIGSYIAAGVSSMGYETILFEEHSEIGNPSHCSGLFSLKIGEMVGFGGFLHYANYARIYAPSGEWIEIGDGRRRAYVVDRVEFDKYLARIAISSGAEIRLKERVRKVGGRIVTTGGEYKARVIVGADGINSIVRREIGSRIEKVINASQAIVRYETDNIERVSIFLGEKIAPGFFGWLIPLDEHMAKVGVGSYRNSYPHLQYLLKKMNLRPISIQFGGIPIVLNGKTYSSNMLIVGDAAAQVKATSGGGIYPGLISAGCAIEAISRFLSDDADLEYYERCWKSRIGKELKRALYLHSIYAKMRDEDFDRIVREIKDEEIISIINEYGDIDYPSKVVWKILRKKPSLLKNIGVMFR